MVTPRRFKVLVVLACDENTQTIINCVYVYEAKTFFAKLLYSEQAAIEPTKKSRFTSLLQAYL